MRDNRRQFLKNIAAVTAGLTCGTTFSQESHFMGKNRLGSSRVSFLAGADRREMIFQVLKPLEKEIKAGIKGKRVLIKPNLVGPDPLCATHVDAVRGILDFLKPLYNGTILVGDSTGRVYPGPVSTFKHFEIHNYLPLSREYNAKLVDLNDMHSSVLWIVDEKFHPFGIQIINTLSRSGDICNFSYPL